jgi:carboxylesterase type B
MSTLVVSLEQRSVFDTSITFYTFLILGFLLKIFESGSAATTILKPAGDREAAWQDFIGGVPGCEKTVNTNNAFGCLRGANQDALLHGMATALNKSVELFPWIPTFDNSILPTLPSELIQQGHFARLPFIAGTNLDEGEHLFYVSCVCGFDFAFQALPLFLRT